MILNAILFNIYCVKYEAKSQVHLYDYDIGPRKMSRKGQHNSETLGLEYFPPDVDNIDTGDLRGLLGSNEPISNVLSIPHPPQTKR